MTRTASQNGKRSWAKGAAFEREIAARLAPLFPGGDVRRNLSQSRGARREGGDLLGLPWHCELKCGANPDVEAALRQGERDAAGSAPVLVIAKRDRHEPIVFLRLSTLTRLPHHSTPVSITFDRFVALIAPEGPAT